MGWRNTVYYVKIRIDKAEGCGGNGLKVKIRTRNGECETAVQQVFVDGEVINYADVGNCYNLEVSEPPMVRHKSAFFKLHINTAKYCNRIPVD